MDSFQKINNISSRIDEVQIENKRFSILRDDLIHPVVSGNKWRKLKYNIENCLSKNCNQILTFGGAYSNHLLATAYACKEIGLKSVGIVRGEELTINSNKTLIDCHSLGMDLHFVSREEYKERYENYYLEKLMNKFEGSYIVPEGGANYYGMIGCQEIMKDLQNFDQIFVAQGTTTTSCGILIGLRGNQRLNVVPVLKNFDSIQEMRQLMLKSGLEQEFVENRLEKVNVLDDYHFGGYGKFTKELIEFNQDFESKTSVPLDQIYTGKCMSALLDNYESIKDQQIIFIHTGGIQGTRSL